MEQSVTRWEPSKKASWGPGPWQEEADVVRWLDAATKLECLIARQRGNLGHLCGYVRIPESHPWYGKSSDDLRTINDHGEVDWVSVHGGLTWSGEFKAGHEDGIPSDGYWVGFDCAHSGDLYPAEIKLGLGLEIGRVYRTISFVEAEVTSLAQQAKNAEKIPHDDARTVDEVQASMRAFMEKLAQERAFMEKLAQEKEDSHGS